MSRLERWPTYPSHKAAREAGCCHCGATLRGQEQPSDYPTGKYFLACHICRMNTYYDVAAKEVA
jgi:hypothetical protein